ncbi:MAG TPA: ATP-dependent sacrificial sulfur transferase LarE [bacterium]|nr:ATP-dependent sacrificial sulfur transferase LarE [bacterium]
MPGERRGHPSSPDSTTTDGAVPLTPGASVTGTAAPSVGEQEELAAKQERLSALLHGIGSAVVAFSGGVDSAYLLAVTHDVLRDRCVAATAVSASLAADELAGAERVAARLGVRHLRVHTSEFEDARYLRNDGQRCYFCKHALFTVLTRLARELDFAAVVYGANADDRGDYRPGMRAASEFAVRAPLLEAGLGKADIRTLARRAGLEVWDKPAAPCLASRLPYGSPVTVAALRQIEAAERVVRDLGFRDVRVRHHGVAASVEVPEPEIGRLTVVFDRVADALREIGFSTVRIAPDGLRSGRFSAGLALAGGGAAGSDGRRA